MLNKRSFAYQAGLLASSNMLLLLLNFIYRILLGRLAGPEGLGVYTLAMQMYGIVMSVCVSGMCVAVTNLSASLRQRGDYQGIRRMIRFAMLCFLALLACMAAPILAFRDMIAVKLLGDSRTAQALGMILLCILLTGFENILKALFNGIREVRFTAASEIGEQTLRIVIALFLLSRLMNGDHGHTAYVIIFGMTLSEVYSVLFLGGNYLRKIGRKRHQTTTTIKGIRRTFLKMAAPSAGTAILANVFASVATIIFPQRLLLAGYTHAEAVSALGLISGMIMPILMLPSALITALCTLLLPSISAGTARGDHADLRRKIGKGMETVGLLGLPSTALLLPFAPILCTLLFGQTAPVALVSLMSLEVVVTYYMLLATSILNGLGRQKQVLYFAGVAEALQLALVWVLSALPALHVYGYMTGMLAGDLLRTMLSFWYIHRITRVRSRVFSTVVVPAACAIVVYCSVRLLFFAFASAGMQTMPALLLSFLLCGVILLLLLRLLGVNIWGYIRRTVFREGHKSGWSNPPA